MFLRFSGYGNITPQTTTGRMVCIPYALVGITIFALFLQACGKTISEHQKNFISHFEQKVLKKSAPINNLEEKSTLMTIFAAILVILIGAVEY